jgi:hypothetical protein
LQPGTYEISVESNGPINVALSGSNCAVSHGQTSYRESCQLQIAATLTVPHADERTRVQPGAANRGLALRGGKRGERTKSPEARSFLGWHVLCTARLCTVHPVLQAGETMNTTNAVQHATAIALLVAAACSNDTTGTTETGSTQSEMAQGLTVFQTTAQLATRFSYKRGDSAVTIETRRGPDTPAEYLELDDAPAAYSTEVYVLDRSASPIYVRAEATGEDDVALPADLAQHAEDLELAPEALRAAAADLATRGSSFTDELNALTRTAALLTEEVPQAVTDKAASAELKTASVTAAASRRHAVALYKGELKKLGVRIGWHSSTRVAYYVNNTWTSIHDDPNHGRYPGEKGMSEVCHWVSAPRTTTRRTAHCTTSQRFDSIMTHNCNDDSHLQVITLRYDRNYSTEDGSCHDKGANPDPDGCDPSTWQVSGNGGGSW